MSNKNEPPNITHQSHTSLVEKCAEILTLGLLEAKPHHKTTITGPNGGTYTGYGSSEEEANKKAGDKYKNGESDK